MDLIETIEKECVLFREKDYDIKVFIENIKLFIKLYKKEVKKNGRERI